MKPPIALLVPILLFAAVLPVSAQEEEASQGPAVSVSPAFYVRFVGETGKNYLLASLVVVNVSGTEIRGITLKQTFPGNLKPSVAKEEIHEFYARPEGYSESIDGQTYTMKLPALHKREQTAGFVTLAYDGRPSGAVIPPAEVEYTQNGQARHDKGPSLTIELTKYTKYSGSLPDFLKRFAGVQIKMPEPGADWGFSGLASRVKARTPIGVVEVDGDASEGRMSILSGAPGDMRDVLLVWKPAAKAKPASSPEEVKKLLGDQIVASADFALDLDGAQISKAPFARGEAWVVNTRWKDRVAARLGGGPVRWYVHQDEKGKQYIMMLRAQGRGAGPGKADAANDEKESALMASLDEIARSFRPL